MRPLVLIPARYGASRLPGKPLLPICGVPMIVHVWRRACEADVGPVVVATDHDGVVAAISDAGGRAVLTRHEHQSGTDRIAEAMDLVDAEARHDIIVNFQGDIPTVAPEACRASVELLRDPEVHVGTPVVLVESLERTAPPQAVKMVGSPIEPGRLRSLYFSRSTIPWGDGSYYHHIGLYAWRRRALRDFISLPPSPLEIRERLEQLRALEAGMRIDAAVVEDVPLGVDTADDLRAAEAQLRARAS